MANGVVTKGVAKTMQKPKPEIKKGDGLFARAKKFLRESYIEVRYKASWPSRSELTKFTGVVITAVLVVAVYIAVLDVILTKITGALGIGVVK